MIGEHYTDESEKYLNSLPIWVCRLEFRCKRCGEVFSDFTVPVRGFRSDACMMNDALSRGDSKNHYFPENVNIIKSHLCNDGGIGVAEYIGLKSKEG